MSTATLAIDENDLSGAFIPDGGTWTSVALLRATASPIPIPSVMWLFGSGLIGLVGLARRKKHND